MRLNFKKTITLCSLLFLVFFVSHVLLKGIRINKNKAIAVGVITNAKATSVSYVFLVGEKRYTGYFSSNMADSGMKNEKRVVVYNLLNPDENLILLEYQLHSKFKLGDDLKDVFDVNNVSVPFWRLS